LPFNNPQGNDTFAVEYPLTFATFDDTSSTIINVFATFVVLTVDMLFVKTVFEFGNAVEKYIFNSIEFELSGEFIAVINTDGTFAVDTAEFIESNVDCADIVNAVIDEVIDSS
jgi:hypothetical protein